MPRMCTGFPGENSKHAMNHSLPWSSVVPSDIRDWLEAFALVHNTRPEFIFMGALVSTAAIMGPKAKVRVSSRYEEPTNIYAICLAEPGAGKSQAFKLVMTEPIHALKEPLGSISVENLVTTLSWDCLSTSRIMMAKQ